MIEAASTSETHLKLYQTTYLNPEDSHVHTHCHEDHKSHPQYYVHLNRAKICADWRLIEIECMNSLPEKAAPVSALSPWEWS
jgi:hypothetical protein